MITVDGSEILIIVTNMWTTLNTVSIDFGLFSFTLLQYEIAVLFVSLILDFMCRFWFADIEQRALTQHYKGAYEWD